MMKEFNISHKVKKDIRKMYLQINKNMLYFVQTNIIVYRSLSKQLPGKEVRHGQLQIPDDR